MSHNLKYINRQLKIGIPNRKVWARIFPYKSEYTNILFYSGKISIYEITININSNTTHPNVDLFNVFLLFNIN